MVVDGGKEGEGSLSVTATLLLASLVSEHPEIQEIVFDNINVKEFGSIALAIQQNRKLTHSCFLGAL